MPSQESQDAAQSPGPFALNKHKICNIEFTLLYPYAYMRIHKIIQK